MNKQRRKEISGIISSITVIKEQIENVLVEEQDSYDGIPENLLCSERAETSEEAIAIMEEVIDSIDDIISNLTDI